MYFECIIPTYNNLEELKRCLQGLSTQSHKLFRAIICIDGSTDGTREWLATQRFSFELLVCEHSDRQNHGRNATRNLALPHLVAEYLCFIDSDLVPQPDLLKEHAILLYENDCVSVGNVQYDNANSNSWSAYAQSRGKNKYNHGEHINYYYLATGNCAHRTELFVELGGQDPHISRYGGGDTEYAIRLHRHYRLPVIFNACSIAVGSMNKSLDEALQQLEDFGRTNLHYIHERHPQDDQIFYLHRMIGSGLSNLAFRFLLRLPLTSSAQALASILPTSIANQLINYCVVSRIYKGWRSGKKEG